MSIRVSNLNISEDIENAVKLISGKIKRDESSFDSNSMIYRTTNETISNPAYIECLKDKKRVLSIIASGDQIINSILFGSQDIVGIDISRYPKYFLPIKIEALKKLNKQDFLNFILGNDEEKPFSKSKYYEIRDNLPLFAISFWDELFYRFNEDEINDSQLFSRFSIKENRMINNNPYLQDDNYEKIQEKIKDVNIELIDYDMFKIHELKIGKFDLINLSNLINYLAPDYIPDELKIELYKEYVKTLPLSKDGIAIVYNFGFNGNLSKILKEKDFKAIKIKDDVPPYNIENELVIYKKNKKLAFPTIGKK